MEDPKVAGGSASPLPEAAGHTPVKNKAFLLSEDTWLGRTSQHGAGGKHDKDSAQESHGDSRPACDVPKVALLSPPAR